MKRSGDKTKLEVFLFIGLKLNSIIEVNWKSWTCLLKPLIIVILGAGGPSEEDTKELKRKVELWVIAKKPQGKRYELIVRGSAVCVYLVFTSLKKI